MEVDIENFGLSSSKPTVVEIWKEKELLATQSIDPLKPYDKTTVKMAIKQSIDASKSTLLVKLKEEKKVEIINHFIPLLEDTNRDN